MLSTNAYNTRDRNVHSAITSTPSVSLAEPSHRVASTDDTYSDEFPCDETTYAALLSSVESVTTQE